MKVFFRKSPKVFHRVFLGAHRYTTKGGTVRLAGGEPRWRFSWRGQAPRTCADATTERMEMAWQ